MPVLSLISGMQAGLGPLSRCHSGVPALQRSQSCNIPFVSAQRSLFTFHWLDIPIRAANSLLAASSFAPSTRPTLYCLSSLPLSVPLFLFGCIYLTFLFLFFFLLFLFLLYLYLFPDLPHDIKLGTCFA